MNRRNLLKALATIPISTSILETDKKESLKILASRKNIEFGAAVGADIFRNSLYRNHIKHHCDVLTPENSLKWKSLVPSKKNYNFHDSDRLYDFCLENEISMRGHALIFEKSMKKWIFECECDLEIELMRFINTITARYPNIRSWDVFNEISDSNGDMGWLKRDTIFNRLGANYLKQISNLVYEVNPKYEQVVNEWIGPYKGRYFDRRRNSILKMLEYFKTQNFNIKTLGIQSHLLFSREDYDKKAWLSFCKECKELGFHIKISEIDLTLGRKAGAHRTAEKVALLVRQYLEDTLSFSNVNSIIAWGLVDSFAYSLNNDKWLDLNYGPSVFTSNYKLGLIGAEITHALKNCPSFIELK